MRGNSETCVNSRTNEEDDPIAREKRNQHHGRKSAAGVNGVNASERHIANSRT
jgi:hypothetical protein